MSPKETRMILVTKSLVFMRFSFISINLLKFLGSCHLSLKSNISVKTQSILTCLGCLESSGQAVFKTIPGFAVRATFEGDIEGFGPLMVLLATTVC